MRLQSSEATEIGLGELGGSDLAGKEGMADGENLGVKGLGRNGSGKLVCESGIGNGM